MLDNDGDKKVVDPSRRSAQESIEHAKYWALPDRPDDEGWLTPVKAISTSSGNPSELYGKNRHVATWLDWYKTRDQKQATIHVRCWTVGERRRHLDAPDPISPSLLTCWRLQRCTGQREHNLGHKYPKNKVE